MSTVFRSLILLTSTTALAVFIVTNPAAAAATQTAKAVIYVAPGGHPVLSGGTAIRGWKP